MALSYYFTPDYQWNFGALWNLNYFCFFIFSGKVSIIPSRFLCECLSKALGVSPGKCYWDVVFYDKERDTMNQVLVCDFYCE